MRKLTIMLMVAVTILGGTVSGKAQERRILVGLVAGGLTDTVARVLAERLRAVTGETFVVENKPGAIQRIAMGDLKRSAPNGRTLMISTTSPFTILPTVYAGNLEYDAVKDFTPIARIAKFEGALAIGPKVGGLSFEDYIVWAKGNPKEASFGTPGAGGSSHFVGVMLADKIGLNLAHVPYRGGATLVNDLVGGHIPLIISALPDLLEHHRAGKLKVIAVLNAERSPLVPEVPTLKELGIDVVIDNALDVWGPAGMAPEIVDRLNKQIEEAASDAQFRARLTNLNVIVALSTSRQLATMIAAERKMWEGPIKASGYKGD